MDAHSRQRTATLAGKKLQALTDPGHLREWAPLKPMGAWVRSEHREAHLGGNGAGYRNKSDASRRSKGAGV